MKKIIMLIVLFVAIFVANHFFNNGDKVNQDVGTDDNSAVIDENGETIDGDVVTVATGTKYLDADISYPKNNPLVKGMVLSEYFSWASDTEILKMTDRVAGDIGLREGMAYQYQAEYSVVQGNNTTSYVYDIYSFTAGAHGSAYKRVYSFDKDNKQIDIAKTLTQAQLNKISKLAYNDIKNQMIKNLEVNSESQADINTEWLAEGTSPTRKNYSVAWYDGSDLVVYFGQYQVAPYVFGEFEVHIPLSSL